MDALFKYAVYSLFILAFYFLVKYYNLKTERKMRTINININKQIIIIWITFIVVVTGITFFIISLFTYEQIVMITCKDGTDEPVNATKYIYCGEDIRPYTIEEYINIKQKEAISGGKPLTFNLTTK
jgi:heme/copper-type cytochrome/quinol oxidase subunit 2